MKTFYWLVKREFWEHRGSFLWTPVITVAVVTGLTLLLIITALVQGNLQGVPENAQVTSAQDLAQIGSVLDFTALMPAGIIALVLLFVLFHYCMQTLSADRADRSILFWKSLPVSDTATVLSKVFSAVVVAPVIAAIMGTIGVFITLLAMVITANATVPGVGFGELLAATRPGSLLAALWGYLPIYMVWMLPSVAWLMLCSAWSRGKVARWALALPVAAGAVISWIGLLVNLQDITKWFWKAAMRLAFSVIPGSWMSIVDNKALVVHLGSEEQVQFSVMDWMLGQLGDQYPLLWSAPFLWGILAAAVMFALAIWLRRWRTEL